MIDDSEKASKLTLNTCCWYSLEVPRPGYINVNGSAEEIRCIFDDI